VTTTTFTGFRFDGRTAEAMAVALHIEDGDLVVLTPEGACVDRVRLDRAVVSDRFDHAPRLVALPDGVTLEVPDPDHAFARGLDEAGERLPLAVRLQRRWPSILVVLAAIVALLVAMYFKGLPVAARWAAFALSPRLEARMGAGTLTVLDGHYLRLSELDDTRRDRITARFTRAAAAVAPGVSYRLEFRSIASSVNAFTLPGGIIVVLDDLVNFTDEDQLLAVLGHELGHVVHKHSTRMILQSVGVGALASLLWGDFAGVASHVPAVLGLLRYSRDFEREADDFALVVLRSQHLSPRPLYDFFSRLSTLPAAKVTRSIPDFMSGHPSTSERLERMQREMEQSR
jgi:Zn-dependent protease with chaperone function